MGTGPRGHYVHAGRGGVYYRASLGRAGQKSHVQQQQQYLLPPLGSDDGDDVNMVEFASADAVGMRDVRFAELLDEINIVQALPKQQYLAG